MRMKRVCGINNVIYSRIERKNEASMKFSGARTTDRRVGGSRVPFTRFHLLELLHAA